MHSRKIEYAPLQVARQHVQALPLVPGLQPVHGRAQHPTWPAPPALALEGEGCPRLSGAVFFYVVHTSPPDPLELEEVRDESSE